MFRLMVNLDDPADMLSNILIYLQALRQALTSCQTREYVFTSFSNSSITSSLMEGCTFTLI